MYSTKELTEMGFGNLLQQADMVTLAVLALLLLMSVLSWFIMLSKALRAAAIRARAGHVVSRFWEAASDEDAMAFLRKQSGSEPFSRIALDCADAAAKHEQHRNRLRSALTVTEFVERSLRHAVTRENARLEGGLILLATVGSTAPFVGLFGTVWGIYHALVRLGASAEASLDAVAAPVGEALIMTAIGLAVAVPAVLGYNLLVRSNRLIAAQFDAFAHDLYQFFATGARSAQAA